MDHEEINEEHAPPPNQELPAPIPKKTVPKKHPDFEVGYCLLCSLKNHTENGLKGHNKRCHTKYLKNECGACQNVFKTQASLQLHRRPGPPDSNTFSDPSPVRKLINHMRGRGWLIFLGEAKDKVAATLHLKDNSIRRV